MTGVLCHIFVDLDYSTYLFHWLFGNCGLPIDVFAQSLSFINNTGRGVCYHISVSKCLSFVTTFLCGFPVLHSLYCLSILNCCVLHIYNFSFSYVSYCQVDAKLFIC